MSSRRVWRLSSLVAVFVAGAVGVSSCGEWPDALTPASRSIDDHRGTEELVLRAVIDSCYLTQRDGTAFAGAEVLVEDHYSGGVFARDSTSDAASLSYFRSWARDSVPDLPRDAVEDFTAVAKDTARVVPFTSKRQHVRFLSDSTIGDYFSRNNRQTRGWIGFRAAFPNGGGITSVSRVGLSRDGRGAVVYAGQQSDWLDGAGFIYVLRADAGSWTIYKRLMLWVS